MENWSAIWGKIKLFYIYSEKRLKKSVYTNALMPTEEVISD